MEHENSHSQLQQDIQKLYTEKISENELFEAESNLLGFFNELLNISKRNENK